MFTFDTTDRKKKLNKTNFIVIIALVQGRFKKKKLKQLKKMNDYFEEEKFGPIFLYQDCKYMASSNRKKELGYLIPILFIDSL